MINRSISCDRCRHSVNTNDADRVPPEWAQVNVWVANKKGEGSREESVHLCPACASQVIPLIKSPPPKTGAVSMRNA